MVNDSCGSDEGGVNRSSSDQAGFVHHFGDNIQKTLFLRFRDLGWGIGQERVGCNSNRTII